MLFMIKYIVPLMLVFSGKMYHPVHVSVLNLEYNNSKPSIDMSLKVFTADLELAMAHNYNIALNLGKPNEIANSATRIETYLAATLGIKVNESVNAPVKLKTKENDGDATRLYISIPVKTRIKNLEIKDMVFMDVYEDQTNLVIVVLNGKEQGYRQSYGSPAIKLKL